MRKIYLKFLTTVFTAFLMLGCEDNADVLSPPLAPPSESKNFESTISGNLLIKKITNDEILTSKIKGYSTNDTDKELAYSVLTELTTSPPINTNPFFRYQYPKINQKLMFMIIENKLMLEVEVDPLLNIVKSYSLIEIDSAKIIQARLNCLDSLYSTDCQNINLSFNPHTGHASLFFNQSYFQTLDSGNKYLLDGSLNGSLSIAPQHFEKIPKASNGYIIIDDKKHEIISAHQSQIYQGSIIPINILSALLDNGDHILFQEEEEKSYSQYAQTYKNIESIYINNNKNFTLRNLEQISTLDLTPSNYIITPDESGRKPIVISGNIQHTRPQQPIEIQYNFDSTESQNNLISKENYIPNDFTIRLINHDIVEISDELVKVRIKNGTLQSIEQNIIELALDDSPNKKLNITNYKCGNSEFLCTGTTVEQNGFGVKFNNTNLRKTNSTESTYYDFPSSLTLNGGLVYPGR